MLGESSLREQSENFIINYMKNIDGQQSSDKFM